MNKRLIYIAVGALSLVAFELVFEGIQYTNPPEWFRPIWMGGWILFQFLALPAHFVLQMVSDALSLPLLVKPTFAEMGTLRVSLLLVMDALEGALLGWLFFFVKSRMRKK